MTVTWKSVRVEIDNTIIDGDDPMAVIDPLWWEVDIYNSLEILDKTSERFTNPQKFVHAICWYNSEVNNGGHYQFFTNSTGIVWKRVLNGFDAAEMSGFAKIVQSCLTTFDGTLPFDRAEREKLLDNSDVDFCSEDNAYYALGENQLQAGLMAYIQRNRDAFKCSGVVQKPVGKP